MDQAWKWDETSQFTYMVLKNKLKRLFVNLLSTCSHVEAQKLLVRL